MPNNVQAIVRYFESGIKPANQPGRLGIELEHIVVDDDSQPVAYDAPFGSKWLLQQFAEEMPEKTFGENYALIGVAKPGVALSLEPAAQVEISAGPFDEIGEIRLDFEELQRRMSELLSPHGHRLLTIGYHPTARADELTIIPKGRYHHMDAHFAKIGTYGRCMMRGSASTQVSIDYYSEADCLRKLRLASGLSPVFALICDNAPAFEGAKRTQHMVRAKIWRECDPARCGLVPGIMDKAFSFERYAGYLLRTPAIFELDANGSSHATDKSFGEIYANKPMTVADVEHVASLFFNDVRLKTYIEIRPADSMPIPFASAYAGLIKGLFYNSDNLDKLDELLDGIGAEDVEHARDNLMQQGYDATVYGRSVSELVNTLFGMAHDALSRNDRVYLLPLAQMAKTKKTLAMLGERTLRV